MPLLGTIIGKSTGIYLSAHKYIWVTYFGGQPIPDGDFVFIDQGSPNFLT